MVLGMKGLAWRSVEIPRLPPKPDLMPLTGGYRQTPVLQVGADIYCDSRRIIAEIDRRHPEPTLYPGGEPGWGELFDLRADPGEHENLFDDPAHRTVRDRMAERLASRFPAMPNVGTALLAKW